MAAKSAEPKDVRVVLMRIFIQALNTIKLALPFGVIQILSLAALARRKPPGILIRALNTYARHFARALWESPI